MLGVSFLPAASRDEAVSSRPREATEIMGRIAQLYKVESACKDMAAEDRRIYRETHARPVIDRLFSRLEDLIHETVPSEPLRKAINPARWQAGMH